MTDRQFSIHSSHFLLLSYRLMVLPDGPVFFFLQRLASLSPSARMVYHKIVESGRAGKRAAAAGLTLVHELANRAHSLAPAPAPALALAFAFCADIKGCGSACFDIRYKNRICERQ